MDQSVVSNMLKVVLAAEVVKETRRHHLCGAVRPVGDEMCYVGYSCNIPDSSHLRISHLIGRNNTDTRSKL